MSFVSLFYQAQLYLSRQNFCKDECGDFLDLIMFYVLVQSRDITLNLEIIKEKYGNYYHVLSSDLHEYSGLHIFP